MRGRVRNHFYVTILVALIDVSAGNATSWKDDGSIDRLTGKRIIQFSTIGHGAIQQFGRTVTSKLTLACTHPGDGSRDYLSAYLWFSDRVAVHDVRARYLFDGGAVNEQSIDVSRRGNEFAISSNWRGDGFFQNLRKSSKLKIQVNLPWAGDPVIEFEVSGANDAIRQMPCR